MQRIEITLEDDLTGGLADETVAFGVEGTAYQIDLSSRHAADFRRRLARFVERARPVRARRSRTARTTASRERSQAIRTWAEHEGLPVAGHGRLPGDIVRRYELAHRGEPPTERAVRHTAGIATAAKRTKVKSRAKPT